MDIEEVDKETIIASSSESENEDKRKRKENRRSRDSDNIKKKRINSADSRSTEEHHRGDKKEYRSEKYNKYKDKNKKDKDYDKYDRREKERDSRHRKRSKSRSRHRSRRRSRSHSSKRRDRKKNYRRSKSRSSRKEIKSEYSRDKGISNVDNNKNFLESKRSDNTNAPLSTSDPAKRDREVYVANLPEGLAPQNVTDLMNEAMKAISANIKTGNPVLSSWISSDSNYAFLEFRSPEEANNAFRLNGISLMGKEIKIGKPRYQDEVTDVVVNVSDSKDMFPTLTSFEKDLSNPYINRTQSSQSTTTTVKQQSINPANMPAQSKLLVSNLPLNFTEDAVYKFLRTFGKIKSLEIIKDPITGNYSGQCHVEFENEAATASALQYAMGINLQGNIIYLKRSSGLVPVYSISSSGGSSSHLGVLTAGMNMSTSSSNPNYMTADDYIKIRENTPSKVICIKNMCTYKELEDDDEYDDLYDDVMEECKNYAKVISVKIPRPEIGENVQGIGKAFVEYFTRDGATFAKEHLNGKTFHGRCVEVVYHPEEMFRKNQLD